MAWFSVRRSRIIVVAVVGIVGIGVVVGWCGIRQRVYYFVVVDILYIVGIGKRASFRR